MTFTLAKKNELHQLVAEAEELFDRVLVRHGPVVALKCVLGPMDAGLLFPIMPSQAHRWPGQPEVQVLVADIKAGSMRRDLVRWEREGYTDWGPKRMEDTARFLRDVLTEGVHSHPWADVNHPNGEEFEHEWRP